MRPKNFYIYIGSVYCDEELCKIFGYRMAFHGWERTYVNFYLLNSMVLSVVLGILVLAENFYVAPSTSKFRDVDLISNDLKMSCIFSKMMIGYGQ